MLKEFLLSITNTGYEVLLALGLANVFAQFLKPFTIAYKRKKLDFSMLISTGGMPSSHSATVTALATSVGIIDGWNSTTFAICICLASIVMYDAAGVRRSASLQARALNQIINELLSKEHTLNKKKLKELLGHTRTEVIAGACLGIFVSYVFHWYLTGSWNN